MSHTSGMFEESAQVDKWYFESLFLLLLLFIFFLKKVTASLKEVALCKQYV